MTGQDLVKMFMQSSQGVFTQQHSASLVMNKNTMFIILWTARSAKLNQPQILRAYKGNN